MAIRDFVVIACILASAPVCFFRPVFGILMWVIMSFANPQDFAWGAAGQASPALLIALPTLAGAFCFSRSWNRVLCRESFLLAALWVWFLVTTLNSANDPAFAEKTQTAWYHWNMISKILLMTVVTVGIIDTRKRLQYLALTIAGSFGFLVIKNIPLMIVSGGAARVYGPPNSMVADNNDFGLALNMALPFFFCLARELKTPRMRWGMALLFILAIPTIFLTYSRGALIGLITVLLAMTLQSKQRGILISSVLLAGLFAIVVAPQSWRDRMNTDNALDASARSRLNVWSYSWALAKDYPLMGGGFDAFTPSLFQKYAPDPRDVHGPHSIYFGVLAEHGFIGLGLYLSIVVSCLVSLTGIAKRATVLNDMRSVRYANMLRFSLFGFLASGAFLGRAYFDFFFTIVAVTAILRRLCREDWSQADSLTSEDADSGALAPEEELATELGDVRA